MIKRLTQRVIYLAVAVFVLGAGWQEAVGRYHVGAPALVYPCPAGSFTKEWWVKDSDPTGAGAPGTLEYHGWREIASCADSTTISGG